MSETIQQISAALATRLGTWLEQPDEASSGLQELRERLGALRGTIGARATTAALRELAGAGKSIRAIRVRCIPSIAAQIRGRARATSASGAKRSSSARPPQLPS